MALRNEAVTLQSLLDLYREFQSDLETYVPHKDAQLDVKIVNFLVQSRKLGVEAVSGMGILHTSVPLTQEEASSLGYASRNPNERETHYQKHVTYGNIIFLSGTETWVQKHIALLNQKNKTDTNQWVISYLHLLSAINKASEYLEFTSNIYFGQPMKAAVFIPMLEKVLKAAEEAERHRAVIMPAEQKENVPSVMTLLRESKKPVQQSDKKSEMRYESKSNSNSFFHSNSPSENIGASVLFGKANFSTVGLYRVASLFAKGFMSLVQRTKKTTVEENKNRKTI